MAKEIMKFEGREIVPKLVWTVEANQNEGWSVRIEGWRSGNEWKWNVHLYLAESHHMFGWETSSFYALPFHGGISYDQVITYSYHNPQWDWQKEMKTRKVGSDYAHEGDWYGEESPMDGVPTRVHVDAAELVSYMREFHQEAI